MWKQVNSFRSDNQQYDVGRNTIKEGLLPCEAYPYIGKSDSFIRRAGSF